MWKWNFNDKTHTLWSIKLIQSVEWRHIYSALAENENETNISFPVRDERGPSWKRKSKMKIDSIIRDRQGKKRPGSLVDVPLIIQSENERKGTTGAREPATTCTTELEKRPTIPICVQFTGHKSYKSGRQHLFLALVNLVSLVSCR